jgi:hypothetical protein
MAAGTPPHDLVLLCDVHHDLVTRQRFGDAWIERCVRERREARESTWREGGGGLPEHEPRQPAAAGSGPP